MHEQMTSQKTDGWLRVGDAVKVTSVKEDYRARQRVYKAGSDGELTASFGRLTLQQTVCSVRTPQTIHTMNSLLGALLLAAVAVSTAHAYCYDAQVAQDQHFDDSFVCKENIPYPAELIDADLHYADLDTLYFLDTATTCFNETNYFTRSYQAPGDYAYQCVCPSPRKRVERIYLNNDVCFVVYPEKQDVQYAQCGGHCSFDYGTRIATSTRGYFCVYQSYVQRQFLVWCPNLAAQAGKVVPAPQQVNGHQLYGRFERVTQNLPTLCSCRGYFCDNHAVHGGPGGIHSQIGGVPAIH